MKTSLTLSLLASLIAPTRAGYAPSWTACNETAVQLRASGLGHEGELTRAWGVLPSFDAPSWVPG